ETRRGAPIHLGALAPLREPESKPRGPRRARAAARKNVMCPLARGGVSLHSAPFTKGGHAMAATPKWDLDDALNRGRAAERLLDEHSAILTPELDEGLGAQLEAD